MAITRVGGFVFGSQNTTNANATWPSVDADDFAVVAWSMESSVTPTTPSGFTLITSFTADASGGAHKVFFYKKFCVGSEDGATLAMTLSSANRHSGWGEIYRGVDLTTPIDGSIQMFDESATTTVHVCPSITPSVAGCSIVCAVHERATSIDTDFSLGGSYTKRASSTTLATGSGGTIAAVGDDGLVAVNSAGVPVTPPSWTGNNGTGTDNILTFALALRAAGAGAGYTDNSDMFGFLL